MTTCHELPAPSAADCARSLALTNIIQLKIQEHNGNIPFADFMELALYHPEHGYYQHSGFTIGAHGDFTTAPEISPLFARCFAKQCLQIFAASGHDTVLELGAGSGRFALDFLIALEADHALPASYQILEISLALREKQRALIAAQRPDLLARITWLTALPESFSGVIIANEVLDAIPFQTFMIHDGRAWLRNVSWHENSCNWQPVSLNDSQDAHTITTLHKEYMLSDGYQSEIQPAAMTLVSSLCRALHDGIILFADYGYGQREYYHPERRQGTLTCFYQHRKHQQPFIYPGLQDLTTHVDFTRVIETAADNGAEFSGFTTQGAFLLANGLLEMAQHDENKLSTVDAFQLHQAIKILTLPTEMGDRVKVMAIHKNVAQPLRGFEMLDRSRDL